MTDSYQVVYNWFDHLKRKGRFINAYVIMPNHLHALITFRNTGEQSINKIVGNGKRFMAYEIVERLKELKLNDVLRELELHVRDADRARNKLHDVFEPSFDWKECFSDKFLDQKVNYIHQNPCRGEWKLVNEAIEYRHSSAKFYFTGQQGVYPVTSYETIKDVDLTKTYDNTSS